MKTSKGCRAWGLIFVTAVTIGMMALLTSCGDTSHQIEAPEDPIKIEGETYSYIILRVEYITEIRQQCENLHPSYLINPSSQAEVQERAKLVAECFFDNMIDINVGELGQFNDEVCNRPIEEQSEEEQQVCEALN